MSTPEERIASLLEKDPKYQDAPVEEEEVEEVEIEQTAEEVEEEAEVEESTEEAEETVDEEVETVAATTIGDLAEHLGVEVSELYGLKVPVTSSDGSKKEISIGEWKDAYRESDLLKAERHKQEQEMQQIQENLAAKAQAVDVAYTHADAMIKAAEKQLLGEIGGLETLHATDPTQYVIKKQELKDKQDELNLLRNKAIQDYQVKQQQVQQDQEQHRQQFLAEQASRLIELEPEWKDEAKMKSEMTEVRTHYSSLGVPDQVLEAINLGYPIQPDAMMVSIMKKAMLWDKQNASKPSAKKKVITIGKKVLKSGKAQTKQSKAQHSKEKDYKSFKKSGDMKDAAAYIEKHLLGDF